MRLASVLSGVGNSQLSHQHVAFDRMIVDHQHPR
jgi:hypothetical protein